MDHRDKPRDLVRLYRADRVLGRRRDRRDRGHDRLHGAAHLPRRGRHWRGRLHAARQLADRRLLSGGQALGGARLLRHGRNTRHYAGQHHRRPDHRHLGLALGVHCDGRAGDRDRDFLRPDDQGAASRLFRNTGGKETGACGTLALDQGDVLQEIVLDDDRGRHARRVLRLCDRRLPVPLYPAHVRAERGRGFALGQRSGLCGRRAWHGDHRLARHEDAGKIHHSYRLDFGHRPLRLDAILCVGLHVHQPRDLRRRTSRRATS